MKVRKGSATGGLKGCRCQNRTSLCQMMKCRVFLRKWEVVRILSRRVTPSVLCIWKIIQATEWSLADAMMGGVGFGDTIQLACNPWFIVSYPAKRWLWPNNGDGGDRLEEVWDFIKEIELTYVEGGWGWESSEKWLITDLVGPVRVALIRKGDTRRESPSGIKGQNLVVQIHPYWTRWRGRTE